MSRQPTIRTTADVPPEVSALCERVNQVSEGLPVLLFLPNAEHSRLYPLVVLGNAPSEQARLVERYLEGERMTPPDKALQEKLELPLEAIHAAIDYLPAIVFLPDHDRLHPINLVPETVPEKLQPCYLAVQRAQKSAIGKQPIEVEVSVAES